MLLSVPAFLAIASLSALHGVILSAFYHSVWEQTQALICCVLLGLLEVNPSGRMLFQTYIFIMCL